MIDPAGRNALTGPNPIAIAVSREAKWVAAADSGPGGAALTVIERNGRRLVSNRIFPDKRRPASEQSGGPFTGLAFDRDENTLWASEGASGRVRQLKLSLLTRLGSWFMYSIRRTHGWWSLINKNAGSQLPSAWEGFRLSSHCRPTESGSL
jgi:hypothetical protein